MKRGGYDLCYWMSLSTSYVYMVELCADVLSQHSWKTRDVYNPEQTEAT